jgi:hypothetical protein
VNGANFTTDSVVQWNGVSLTTSFISDSQLSSIIPANLLTTGGAAEVSVLTPGFGEFTSNTVLFTIKNYERIFMPLVIR